MTAKNLLHAINKFDPKIAEILSSCKGIVDKTQENRTNSQNENTRQSQNNVEKIAAEVEKNCFL